jgi:hypothetical protein
MIREKKHEIHTNPSAENPLAKSNWKTQKGVGGRR